MGKKLEVIKNNWYLIRNMIIAGTLILITLTGATFFKNQRDLKNYLDSLYALNRVNLYVIYDDYWDIFGKYDTDMLVIKRYRNHFKVRNEMVEKDTLSSTYLKNNLKYSYLLYFNTLNDQYIIGWINDNKPSEAIILDITNNFNDKGDYMKYIDSVFFRIFGENK